MTSCRDSLGGATGTFLSAHLWMRHKVRIFRLLCIPRNCLIQIARRTLHVFNREGYLQNVSEPIALLEHTLDWKPSGNLIACSQKLSHKHDIVFFERNGLRHGEFSLRSNGAHVQGLKYNSDSTILGIHLIEADGSHVFQLWTMNNYYYYMKQSLKVPAGVQILQVVWDSELPLQLYLLTSDGHLLSKHFAFDILRSACLSPSHPGTVAVIDGTDLKLTFFKYQNVPPPMSSLGVSLSAPISFVSFCPFELGTRMVVMLNNGNAELFDTKGSSASDLVKMPQNVGSIRVPAHIRQLVWVHPVMLAGIQSMGDCDTVVLIHLTDTDGRLSVNGIEPVEFAFSSLLLRLTVTHDLRLICQDTEATVFQIAQDENGVPVVEQKAFFPKPCPWFTSTYVGPNRTEEVFIGLSERNSLYLEDKVLSPDCTSFALHDQFLVMTTLAHTTCFISLDLPRNGEIFKSLKC